MQANTFGAQLAAFKESRQALTDLWREGIPSFCPTETQWAVWLQLHDPTTLMSAILTTQKKFNRVRGNMEADYLVRYCSSVANRIKGERSTTQHRRQMANEQTHTSSAVANIAGDSNTASADVPRWCNYPVAMVEAAMVRTAKKSSPKIDNAQLPLYDCDC